MGGARLGGAAALGVALPAAAVAGSRDGKPARVATVAGERLSSAFPGEERVSSAFPGEGRFSSPSSSTSGLRELFTSRRVMRRRGTYHISQSPNHGSVLLVESGTLHYTAMEEKRG